MASATTKDMTHGVPWRLIAGFAIPVFLSQLFQQLYNTADSLIVSNFLGDNALAAVSASGPLIFLLISFFAGAASGVGVAIARYFGAGDYDKVSRTVHTAVLLGLISSLILTVIGVLFTPTLLLWMDTDPEVLPDAIGYFRCYFAGVGAGVMYNTFTGIMNALGDSKRPLYFLIVSSVTNVILDLLFVAVLRWGVWSAALATIISQALSAVLCVIHLAKKGTIYQLKLSALRLDGPLLREILRYGLPAGIQNSVIGLANVVVQTNINSFGKMATAAYGAYSKIEGFAFLPVTSFTMAITTYVGQNLGAGMKPRARKGAIFGIAAAAIIAELIGIATYLAGDTDHLPVLLPAGILPRHCQRVPRRGQSLRAHVHHAGRVVRVPHPLHHRDDAVAARDRLRLLGLSHHMGHQLGDLPVLLPAFQLAGRIRSPAGGGGPQAPSPLPSGTS